MGFMDRLFIAAGEEARDQRAAVKRSVTWLPIKGYGKAEVVITVGDMDGSGDAPGVQLEIAHALIEGGSASVAFSGQEAEAVAAALHAAAQKIPPSERLRPVRRRLKQQRKGSGHS